VRQSDGEIYRFNSDNTDDLFSMLDIAKMLRDSYKFMKDYADPGDFEEWNKNAKWFVALAEECL
jgi:hypothetical protein